MHQEFVQVDKNLCEEIIEVRSSGKKIFVSGQLHCEQLSQLFQRNLHHGMV